MSNQDLETEILHAINNDEFVLYYQPQFNLTSSIFDGVEALIRWHHPIKGMVLPDEFISTAEKSDLIVAIGEWVLKTACLQFKIWQDKGLSPGRIAVNVSERQFKQIKFVEFVINTLSEMNLTPQCLELELSENMVIHEDDKNTIQMINELNQQGILIALDDFGMGCSTADHLKKIPVHRIKIDKSYIKDIHNNERNAEMVKSFITLASQSNVQIVAEGVETLKELQMLLTHQCMQIQGYYFSEPLPAEKLEQFLIANREMKIK